jgi:hypothetical protein
MRKPFEEFLKTSKHEDNVGIYLGINKKYAYLIIWPGKNNYEGKEDLDQKLILTLIRYGFYLSSNSILCFTKSEIKDFNPIGYKIFEKEDKKATTRRARFINKKITEEKFEIKERKELDFNEIKEKSEFGMIKSIKVNQNYLIIYLENVYNFDEFIEEVKKKKISFIFDENFNIIYDKFLELIKSLPDYQSKKNHCDNIIGTSLSETLESIIYEVFKKLNKKEKTVQIKFIKKELLSFLNLNDKDLDEKVDYFLIQ